MLIMGEVLWRGRHAGGIWEISTFQICWELKTALKNEILKNIIDKIFEEILHKGR